MRRPREDYPATRPSVLGRHTAVCSLSELNSIALIGYLQVADAYLIGLARHHQGRVATLDRAMPELAAAKPGEASIVELIG